jgi:hypothetical protein
MGYRRKSIPDTRPRWFDDDTLLPIVYGRGRVDYVSKERMQELAKREMQVVFLGEHWKNDPTYFKVRKQHG